MLTESCRRGRLIEMSKVKDFELNNLFKEVNKEFPNKYFLRELEIEKTNFFGRNKKTKVIYYLYSLNTELKEYNDLQILNICNNLTQGMKKQEVETFFYGLLNGKK